MAVHATTPEDLDRHMSSVLLIEDDPHLRTELANVLRETGHQIIEASDGQAGLVQFHAHNPELVLTEVSLPEKGGLEIIAEIIDDRPLTKVFAISQPQRDRGVDLLEIATMLGAVRTFVKPVDVQNVVAAVRDELGTNESSFE